ncbi:MAG: DUF5343 domain-containing protein [Thaumarchaeota archaeon]|nr:DUF5343 domain-containing protein [Nitrososphaerota archaeon]
MVENMPYVGSYAQLSNLFAKIQEAAVPTKFTHEFMKTMLDLRSSNYFPMIPFLKKIGFLDASNIPTQDYKDYRDPASAKFVMAKCIKQSYEKIFQANEFADKLSKEELTAKVKTITGLPENNSTVLQIVGTFMELAKLADFSAKATEKVKEKEEGKPKEEEKQKPTLLSKLGISYTINLNLPATPDVEVFNAIFKSLKEHILNE